MQHSKDAPRRADRESNGGQAAPQATAPADGVCSGEDAHQLVHLPPLQVLEGECRRAPLCAVPCNQAAGGQGTHGRTNQRGAVRT